jgi:hypothetical protein
LNSSGRLHGNSEVDDDNYTPGTYCVFNGNQGIGYAKCNLESKTPENNYCEDVRKYTFNIGFVLSIIFIIFSIIAHIRIKKKQMFVKMSLVYLVNMLGQYLVIVVDRFLEPEGGSIPCVWIAYLKQYFNLSFFFSINVLAIILYNSINAMGNEAKFRILRYMGKVLDPDKNSFFWKGIVYVQGVPLLITLVTWIIDQRRIQLKQMVASGQISSFDTTSYPEAGVVYCYLSYQNPDENNKPSYFVTPEFIYVQSVQALLLISNLVLFGMAIQVFRRNHITPDNQTEYEGNKKKLTVIFKLFLIMICFWTFEIVTSAIVAAGGINGTCELRFVFDAPNAFFGVLAFLVLGKPPVLKELRRRGKRFLTCQAYAPTETSGADTTSTKLTTTKSS